MYTFGKIAALSALLCTVAAVPMVKRELVINTVTQVDVVTEYMTATVWVDGPGETPALHDAHYSHEHGHNHRTSAVTTSQAQPTTTSSVYVAPPPPPPPASSSTSTTSTSTSQVVAPAYTAPPQAPSSTSVYVAPPAATSSVYVAPAPAPAPAYTPAPSPATTTTPPAAASSASAGSSDSKSYTGEITYYDVGLGSCGITNTNTDMVVAMSAAMMNKATMCGKTITINYGGKSHQATVVDTCPGCSAGSLDLSPSLFQVFSGFDAGRVKDVSWSFN